MDSLLDYLLNVDFYLGELVDQLGPWVYAVIFASIFAEIGLVVLPFLPGESLLLASGTLASLEILDIAALAPLLFLAAFIGMICNFLIGRIAGRRLLSRPRRWLDPARVQQVHDFYERHGALAIAVSRFLPVVRTLAPFMAGVARMETRRLVLLAVVATVAWVGIFLGSGYGLGSADWVRRYLALVLVGIVIVPGIPNAVAYLVRRRRSRNRKGARSGPE